MRRNVRWLTMVGAILSSLLLVWLLATLPDYNAWARMFKVIPFLELDFDTMMSFVMLMSIIIMMPFFLYGLLTLIWYGAGRAMRRERPLLWTLAVSGVVWLAGVIVWILPNRRSPLDAMHIGSAALGVFCGVGGLALLLWLMKRFPKIVNRSTILYLVFGVLTTIINFAVYVVCTRYLLHIPDWWNVDWNVLAGNAIAWVAAVSTAYITNRVWVFDSRVRGWRALTTECVKFFTARLVTLGMQTVIMWLGTTILRFPDLAVLAVSLVFVLIANYIASKVAVFNKK